MSEYERIVKSLRGRGRPCLDENERKRRRAEQVKRNRLRQEAKRRAWIVLSHRHAEEFEELFRLEHASVLAKTTSD